MSLLDPGSFKHILRHYPSGVTVVTSLKNGEPRGITLTSFASVSADPPMVLICVNREARSYLYIATSGIFCVNILASTQRDLAEHFSGKVRDEQFRDVAYSVAATGAPVLRGSLGFLDCTVTAEHHAGSHSIFVGNVQAGELFAGTPLAYLDRTFFDAGTDAG